jgi:hypothetical protein
LGRDRDRSTTVSCRLGHRGEDLHVVHALVERGAGGFPHRTCFPAATRPSTISRCSELATTTLTTWISVSAIASQEVSDRS